jgi:Protein of unknown function (DUF3574)
MRQRRALITAVLTAFLLSPLAATAWASEALCPAPMASWTEINLYFGRKIGEAGLVSEKMFRHFLADVVTPRFPDGLTVLDAAGQFRSGNRIIREPTKLLILLVPDRTDVADKVAAVIDRYKRRFRQQSVLRTEQEVCLAF